MDFFFSMAGEIVQVQYDIAYIKAYLEREFSLLQCGPSAPSLVVKINSNAKNKTNSKSTTPYLEENVVFQFFKAFQRHFWIRYWQEDGVLFVQLDIPYGEKEGIKKFMSPFFEGPLYCCLADFFHNPFLAVAQYLLLKKGISLFHCSSFFWPLFNETVVLAGGAGSGKSTLMINLAKSDSIQICSEDFAFVTSDGRLYGYPHQTRVRFRDMSNAGLLYYDSKKGIKMVLDKLNKIVFSQLMHGENGRHFAICELFENQGYKTENYLDSKIFYIVRRGDNTTTTQIAPEAFCSVQTEIILSEFWNMTSAIDILKLLGELNREQIDVEFLRSRVYGIYMESLGRCRCIQVEIPYYPIVEDASNELKRIILNS